MANPYTLLRPLIHVFPPEAAHSAAIFALKSGLVPASRDIKQPSLQLSCFGLSFSNPVGLAAGFDKNAVAIDALLAQGFGFVEAGTVTPRPQQGNPKPRIFRLAENEAVINRLGFNNEGLEAYVRNFSRYDKSKGIAGANIGKNKDSADAIQDYKTGMQAVYPLADYITVNISSPNTPGLRDLQKNEALDQLLSALTETRKICAQMHARQVPLLLKVAPDLEPDEIASVASLVMTHKLDGLVVGNTTLSRPESLRGTHMAEQGGLSGRPLFALSTDVLRQFYRHTGGQIPIIGVGGIASPEDAYLKIRAGASLVQLYTALTYQGFGLVRKIREGLVTLLVRDGYSHVSQAVGTDVK